jgi:hypothetical protein
MSLIELQSQKVENIRQIFLKIEKKSNELMKKARSIDYDKTSKTLREILDLNDDITAQNITLLTAMLLSKDAEQFLKEKDEFDFTKPLNYKNCQFISEIWSGDTYETKEYEALKEFLADIEESISIVSDNQRFLRRCQAEYINILKNDKNGE